MWLLKSCLALLSFTMFGTNVFWTGATTSTEMALGDAMASTLKNLMIPRQPHLSVSTNGGHSSGISYSVMSLGVLPAQSTVGSGSTGYVDCILVLDSSGSVGAADFNFIKTSAKGIVDFINSQGPIFPSGSRIGVVEFSEAGRTRLVFGLGAYQSAKDVNEAINNIAYQNGGGTNTALGLDLARRELWNPYHTSNNARTVWVLTDGQSNEGGNPRVIADLLRDNDVLVCAVGIGSSANKNEINDIGNRCARYAESTVQLSNAVHYMVVSSAGQSVRPTVSPNYFSGLNIGKRFLRSLKKKSKILQSWSF